MKKLLLTTAMLVALIAPTSAETTGTKRDCIQYDKQTVTLSGTVLVRRMTYGKDDITPPEGDHSFDLLVLDKPICAWGDGDEPSSHEWALHLSDADETCERRNWPARVKVTGTIFPMLTWHHHTKVLFLAKKIERLDGKPACTKTL